MTLYLKNAKNEKDDILNINYTERKKDELNDKSQI
jgi:hypothetical protein